VTRDAARGSAPLWVAIVATVLSLGLPLAADLPGRALTVRVLLVGAVVLLAIAAFRSRPRDAREHLVVAALGLLVFTAALVIRAITPTGAVLLTIAIGSLLWQRHAWARSPDEPEAVRGRQPS
jgi:hypothetical protein